MRHALAALLSLALGACGLQQPLDNGPTAPGATTDGTGGPALAYVGRWASPTSSTTVAKLSSCSNFQWNVTSQTGNSITGQFSAVCLGAYQVTGTASGQLDGGVAHIVLNASATLPTVGVCPVTLTADGTLDGDIIRLPYNAQTCLGNYSGTETLRKSQLLPQPNPEPQPEPPPPPPPPPPPSDPGPASADELDLSQVTYVLGPSNVGAWPQTSTMTATRAIPHELCTYHTKLGQWPSTLFFDTDALVEGNQWVFANIGGRWYGGAGEWQRPGQACKDVTAESIGADAFYNPNMEPLRSWVPRPGEVFGLMVTTPARAWPDMRTLDQRSNVVLVRWGS